MKFKDLKILSCGKVHCEASWTWDTGLFRDYDLWTVLGGRGLLVDRKTKREYELSAGDCFILQKGESYYGSTDKRNPLLVVYIHFDFDDSDESKIPDLYRKIEKTSFFSGILDRFLLSVAESAKEESEVWFNAAIAEINSTDRKTDANSAGQSRLKTIIEELKNEIIEYPGKKYSLKDISFKAGFCRDHFAKAFKASGGISFMDFLIYARLERAKYLLRTSGLKISDIASQCGYSDIYIFSRQFKNKTGSSPSSYRENQR